MILYKNKKGQILLEFFWVLLFFFGFLSSFGYFYQKSQKHIEEHRMGKVVKHEGSQISIY